MKHLNLFRRPAWLTTSAVVLVLTALLVGFATVGLAAGTTGASGTTGAGGASGAAALPGDPTKGQAVYTGSGGCTVCHGANLEGGIGAKLHPLEKLGNTDNPADPTYLIGVLTNGLNGAGKYSAAMPAFKGKLSDQDIKDVVSYIIAQQAAAASNTLSAGELAKSTITWVTIGVLLMIGLTWLLSQYNMRWIARKVAARKTGGRV